MTVASLAILCAGLAGLRRVEIVNVTLSSVSLSAALLGSARVSSKPLAAQAAFSSVVRLQGKRPRSRACRSAGREDVSVSCHSSVLINSPCQITSMAVTLDGNDATLDLALSDDRLTVKPFLTQKYPQLWSGIRANSSASGGKLFFTVKVVRHQSDDGAQPECLIGISTRSTAVSQLGSGISWAYASSGHKWTGSKSETFATAFSVGDCIGCLLDLENETGSLSFTHNGKWLGAAFDVPQPDSSQNRLFPHILLKDLEVEVDFSGAELDAGKNWPAEASEYVSWTVWFVKTARQIVSCLAASSMSSQLPYAFADWLEARSCISP